MMMKTKRKFKVTNLTDNETIRIETTNVEQVVIDYMSTLDTSVNSSSIKQMIKDDIIEISTYDELSTITIDNHVWLLIEEK